MTKVQRLVNYATKYEVIVTNDRETYLVSYRLRQSRTQLLGAIRAHGHELLAVLALPENASFTLTSPTSARLGDWWTVKFTGRTQKDAICTHSEYRYIGTVASEKAAQ